jgi:hypothetical protein
VDSRRAVEILVELKRVSQISGNIFAVIVDFKRVSLISAIFCGNRRVWRASLTLGEILQ